MYYLNQRTKEATLVDIGDNGASCTLSLCTILNCSNEDYGGGGWDDCLLS